MAYLAELTLMRTQLGSDKEKFFRGMLLLKVPLKLIVCLEVSLAHFADKLTQSLPQLTSCLQKVPFLFVLLVHVLVQILTP